MDKNKPFEQMTDEQLLSSKKSITTITSLLAGMLVILLAQNIYIWVTKGSSALIAVPLALSPIVIINFKKASAIKKELQARGRL